MKLDKMTEEDFSKLDLEDMKKVLLEVLEELPDDAFPELYEKIKTYMEQNEIPMPPEM